MFLDLVEGLTGGPLAADAWVGRLRAPLDELLAAERREYDAAVKEGPKWVRGSTWERHGLISVCDCQLADLEWTFTLHAPKRT
jgi:hypothetical protein